MMNKWTKQVIVVGLLGVLLSGMVLATWTFMVDHSDNSGTSDMSWQAAPDLVKETAYNKSGTFVTGSRSGTVQAKPK